MQVNLKLLLRWLTRGVSRHLNDAFAFFSDLPWIEGADPHRHLHRGPCHGALSSYHLGVPSLVPRWGACRSVEGSRQWILIHIIPNQYTDATCYVFFLARVVLWCNKTICKGRILHLVVDMIGTIKGGQGCASVTWKEHAWSATAGGDGQYSWQWQKKCSSS